MDKTEESSTARTEGWEARVQPATTKPLTGSALDVTQLKIRAAEYQAGWRHAVSSGQRRR
jgi:hypothetical protein